MSDGRHVRVTRQRHTLHLLVNTTELQEVLNAQLGFQSHRLPRHSCALPESSAVRARADMATSFLQIKSLRQLPYGFGLAGAAFAALSLFGC